MYVLSVVWYNVSTPALYGPFKTEDLAFAYFDSEQARRNLTPYHAFLYGQTCPSRKPFRVESYYVDGEWR